MEKLQLYTHTATRLFLRWLAMLGLGLLLSVAGIVIGFALLGSEASQVTNTHQSLGLMQTVLAYLKQDLWPMLLVLSSVGFVAIYFILAGNISMRYLIGQLYANQLAPIIGQNLTRLLTAIIDKKPEWWHSINDANAFKIKLAQATRQDHLDTPKVDSTLHKMQRKAMLYALKKTELDDVDFKPSNPHLASDISDRVMTKLAALAESSSLPYWVAVVVHVMLAMLALMLDH